MKTLTIVEPDNPGLLAAITTLLEEAGIDVRDIDGHTTGDKAVISLRAVPYGRCHRVLSDAGYKVLSAHQLLVRVEDKPGALAELSRRLANAQVDIRSIHFVGEDAGGRLVALETANPFLAGQVLQDLVVPQAS